LRDSKSSPINKQYLHRLLLEKSFQEEKKKRQATHIAPLQPLILAVFLPWGGSAGAGRVRPAGCKCKG